MISRITPVQTKDEPQPITQALKLRGRVLLAEDGLDNQRLIGFILQNAGATIETAINGRIALEMLKQAEAAGKSFDILLADMQIPELDGYNLARILREHDSQIPIIALTAHAMTDDQKNALTLAVMTTSPNLSTKLILLQNVPTGLTNKARQELSRRRRNERNRRDLISADLSCCRPQSP